MIGDINFDQSIFLILIISPFFAKKLSGCFNILYVLKIACLLPVEDRYRKQ